MILTLKAALLPSFKFATIFKEEAKILFLRRPVRIRPSTDVLLKKEK